MSDILTFGVFLGGLLLVSALAMHGLIRLALLEKRVGADDTPVDPSERPTLREPRRIFIPVDRETPTTLHYTGMTNARYVGEGPCAIPICRITKPHSHIGALLSKLRSR
jgi:hypothetical protein